MLNFSSSYLSGVGMRLFRACGAPDEDARIVTSELVEASLMGIDSHGIIRFIWYVDEVLNGKLKPGAPLKVVKESPTTAVVDCGFNFGPVSGMRMTEIAYDKARAMGVSCVTSVRSHHVSRLGAYPQRLAERNMICFAVASCYKQGHWVAPWGGREGRLATNPLAYGVPGGKHPIILDMSTSMIPEGKIKSALHKGLSVPEGCILDAEGHPTTDPKAFYGPPMGTILPFGSEYGYKGFGLGLLVEMFGAALAGEDLSDEYRYINCLTLITIDPDAFCGAERYVRLIDELSAYMTGTPPAPGFDRVVMPGAYDFETKERRLREGIPVAEETWRQIGAAADKLGVTLDDEQSVRDR